MKSIIIGLLISLSWTTIVAGAPTTDNTCGLTGAGANKGYTCVATLQNGGPCCSANGYCGSADGYCGTGCQSAYGKCGTAASSSAAATRTATVAATPSKVLTPDNSCGNSGAGGNKGYTCDPNLAEGGACCSANGYCGSADAYCGAGCQSAFGTCGIVTSTTSASTPGQTGSTTVCGPQNGNAVCAAGLCCSIGGYCGQGTDYCGDPDCQFNFGTCDSNTTPAGNPTSTDPRPLFGDITYTDDIYDCVQANVVALSFDDGPLSYTNQLLDILKQFNFKATFFMTGNNLGKGAIDVTAPYPTVIKRMIADGHHVASHTWSHYDLSTLTTAQRIQQMAKNERAIANIIGKYPTYMRPPYSSCSQESGCWDDMQKLGYHRTYFDLDTQDYLNQSPSLVQNSKNIVKWALGNATQGSDFLSIQHDIGQQSVTNLSSYYFDLIRRKGWKGVSVGECLGDPETNWYRVPGTGQAAPISLTAPAPTPTTTKSTPPGTGKPTTTTTTTLKQTTSTTKISTTTTPRPTPQCDEQSGTFCGKIQSFNSKNGCTNSYRDCQVQNQQCQGKGTKEGCSNWSKECTKLGQYCNKCGNNCSDAGFRASQE